MLENCIEMHQEQFILHISCIIEAENPQSHPFCIPLSGCISLFLTAAPKLPGQCSSNHESGNLDNLSSNDEIQPCTQHLSFANPRFVIFLQ